MTADWQQFLGERLRCDGLAAWAARFPDRTVASHCYTDWFSTKQIERILSRLVLAGESLTQHGIQPSGMSWVFEHARVCVALRQDGGCLALFVENRPDLPRPSIEGVLEDFARLQ